MAHITDLAVLHLLQTRIMSESIEFGPSASAPDRSSLEKLPEVPEESGTEPGPESSTSSSDSPLARYLGICTNDEARSPQSAGVHARRLLDDERTLTDRLRVFLEELELPEETICKGINTIGNSFFEIAKRRMSELNHTRLVSIRATEIALESTPILRALERDVANAYSRIQPGGPAPSEADQQLFYRWNSELRRIFNAQAHAAHRISLNL